MVELPFSDELDILLALADAVPEASPPHEVLVTGDGTVDEDFFDWWIPEQQQWQVRARAAMKRLIDEHPPTDEWIDGKFPGWYGTWWSQVLEFPWAARLGEAVGDAENWLESNGDD